ncbi:MAG: EamA family transporter, partial [Thermomicrobiales bacterium]
FTVASLVIYAIPFAILIVDNPPDWDGLRFVLASSVVHVGYFVLLARSYRDADLSIAYPIARGTGVLLAPILAVPIYGDRPTVAAWVGIAAILGGIVWLHAPALRRSVGRVGIGGVLAGPPLLTGLTIATYSLIDAGGARRVQPLVYLYLLFALAALFLAPYMVRRRWAAVRTEARNPRSVAVAGGAAFGTYVMVLAAMRLAPVSYVVPIREVSIVFAVMIGVWWLGERLSRARVGACLLVTAGVVLIGVAG